MRRQGKGDVQEWVILGGLRGSKSGCRINWGFEPARSRGSEGYIIAILGGAEQYCIYAINNNYEFLYIFLSTLES